MRKKFTFLLVFVITLALSSCITSKNTTDVKNVSLINTRWGLQTLNGQELDKSKIDKEIFLIFRFEGGRFEGFAGCNGIGGEYEEDISGTLKMSKIISTMMACPAMEIETQFNQALNNTDTYKIIGDELFLYDNGKEVAKLYAVYLR